MSLNHLSQNRGQVQAQSSEAGLLLRQAIDLKSALKLGIRISLDEIRADEFCAMLTIAEEQTLLDQEKLSGSRHNSH